MIYSIKVNRIDYQKISQKLQDHLLKEGALSARELCVRLGVSQPVFSRIVGNLKSQILTTGSARLTRYALKKEIAHVGTHVPVYQITPKGKTIKFAVLHAVYPKGFYLESHVPTAQSRFFADLPYFLADLKPTGFLGRLVPKMHPELGLPPDIRLWSTQHHLKYLTQFGWDTVGNYIIGDAAFNLYLQNSNQAQNNVALKKRPALYPKLAEKVLESGMAGSSAGGEQAKFLGTKGPHITPVLVKFSPVINNQIAERMADLLLCEHLAHSVLAKHGCPSAKSEIIEGGKRLFLEIERFDRCQNQGRLGLMSLGSLDMGHVGQMTRWGEISEALFNSMIINETLNQQIHFLEFFGTLIGNNDMHPGNISLFVDGETILKLAPVYDMLPMLYYPANNQLFTRTLTPPLPNPNHAPVWIKSWHAAMTFWNRVKGHRLLSTEFKKIAVENIKTLETMRQWHKKLPL
ncbi:MAG: type II toxin-antitoxin system HipA family toxin YjjJ [Deltaproteobacteria bacterium]|nr:type II toxin-antitoxin system HipA family toxin YjjJ [Deltaproteobacteria bacterium]